ncbi:MAG TPA: cupin domain-containing protein [Trebonia sp.]
MSVTSGTSEPVLVRYQAAERLGAGHSHTLLLADSDTTNGAVSANRAILEAGADGPPPHLHRRSTEVFFVLGGSLTALAGDQVITLEKGDFLSVPPGMPHAFGASPGSDADVLIMFSPAATKRFEYFRLVDKVIKGEATVDEVLAAEERFDNHFFQNDLWQAARQGASERGH